MIHASSRTFTPAAPADLSLPRWAFVAWGYRGHAGAAPQLAFAPGSDADIEARRRARLLREIVPQG